MNYTNIILREEDRLAFIELNRPDKLNALSWELIMELDQCLTCIRSRTDLGALIISGRGENFAAGADIADMVERTPQESIQYTFNRVFNELEELPVPVIAAVRGYALGGGLELALACDFRFCSGDARLGLPEIKLGIFPGAGGTQRLPRLIGLSRAKEMIFAGQYITAAKALEYGLCDRLTAGDPAVEAEAFARQLLERPPIALSCAKKVINYGTGRDLRTGIAMEEEVWASLFSTEDQEEGMRAFLEKRKPVFKGR